MSEPPHAPDDTSAPGPEREPWRVHCANCGTELRGAYCHRCGQPAKQTLKHLPALAADAADAVLNIDGRIMRTLPALYLRPGFLPQEYFSGRRVRYVAPFRLMFFMSVLAFLLIHLALLMDQSLADAPFKVTVDDTPTQVHADARDARARIAAARQQPDMPALGQLALALAAHAVPKRANQRLAELDAAPMAAASLPAPPSTTGLAQQLHAIANAPSADAVKARADAMALALATSMRHVGKASPLAIAWLGQMEDRVGAARKLGLARLERGGVAAPASAAKPLAEIHVPAMGTAAERKHRPVHFSRVSANWLPAFVDNRINDGLHQAEVNLTAMRGGSPQARREALRRVARNALSATPATLFVLIPILAALLKLMYVFKSRLYIEHLIVTLYSHAFIFLTLFLSVLLAMIAARLPALRAGAHWLQAALWIWFAAYLLLMQKRVYAQGWFLTLVKYCCTGVCYGILLTFALIVVALIGLSS